MTINSLTRNKKHALALGFCLIILTALLIGQSLYNVKAATVTWDGGGADGTCGGSPGDGNKWSCGLNWSTDAVPTSADVATFDGTSTKDVTIDSNINVLGIDINSGYTGTITQASTVTITVDSSGFAQDDGIFVGGDSAIDINDGSFTLGSGAGFTATSGTLSVERNFTINNSTTWDNNSGSILFDGSSVSDDTSASCGSKTFNTISLNKGEYRADLTIGSDCSIDFGNSPTLSGGLILNNGSVVVGTGTWTLNASYSQTSAGATTTFGGTTMYVNDRVGSSATVASLTLTDGSFTAGSMTTLRVRGSLDNSANLLPSGIDVTLDASGPASDATITCSGSESFNSFTISKHFYSADLVIDSTCSLDLGNSPTVDAGTITNNGSIIVGTGTWTINASYTQSNPAASTTFGGTTIYVNDKDGVSSSVGNLTLTNGTFTAVSMTTLRLRGSLNNSADLLPTGLNVTLDASGTASDGTITCTGNEAFSSFTIDKASYGGDVILTALCNIDLGNSPTVNGGVIANNGTLTIGTGTWTLNASFTQNDPGASTTFAGTAIDVNDRAGLTVYAGALTLSDGTFTAASLTSVNLQGDLLNSGNLLPDGTALTLDASGIFSDGDITCGTTIFSQITITKGSSSTTKFMDDCTTSGTFTRNAGPILNSDSPATLTVQGDLITNATDAFGGSNLELYFTGGSSQTATQNASLTFASPIFVNKSGNELILSTDFTTTNAACNVMEGVFDINGHSFTCGLTFTVEDGGTLRLQGDETVTEPVLDTGSTVEYHGNGDTNPDVYNLKDWSYYNLTINLTDANDEVHPGDSLAQNLYAQWDMDEASGSNIADSSGNGYDVTAVNTTVVGGISGNARSLNRGTSDYMYAAAGFDDFTNGFTISAWVYPTSVGGWERIIDFANGSPSNNILLARQSSTSNLVFEVYNGTSSGGQINASGAIQQNAWQHFVATVDGLGNAAIYKNGSLVASGTTAVPVNITRNNVYIGRSNWGTDARYNGYFDQFRVYQRGFTEEEALSLYNMETSNELANLTLPGNLTLSGGTFVSPPEFTLTGNFIQNGGTFDANGRDLTLDGTNQNVSGTNTFYNLTKQVSSSDTLTFEANTTQTILNDLVLTGTDASSLLALRSDNPTNDWYIDPQGTRTIAYLDVQDSNNTNATAIDARGTNSLDSLRNTNWLFDDVFWTGLGDGTSWNDGANWSTGVVPTAADDVLVNETATVNVEASKTVNSLTLGNSGGTKTPTLNFTYDAIGGSAFIVDDSNLTVYTGSTITHAAGGSGINGTINIDVQTGSATIDGSINASSKGYSQGYGSGVGTGHSGATHGGTGGTAFDGGPSAVYDSISAPTMMGSGGRNEFLSGGVGGGAVKLNVASNLDVDGSVTADGGDASNHSWNDAGGGSGGAVYITTGTLTGAGSMTATGGDSLGAAGGAGGGGRIAVWYTNDSSTITYSAAGGQNNQGRDGGAGTVFTKAAAQTNGDLLIDGGNDEPTDDRYRGRTPLGTITLDNLTLQNYGNLELTGSTDITYTTFDWSTKGVITDNGGTLDFISGGGDLTIPSTAYLFANMQRTYNSITVNGILTHTSNTTTETYTMDLDVTTDLTIGGTGKINVDYRGYEYGEGPGAGTAVGNGSSGAGYGGDGGDGALAVGGSAYGDEFMPVNIGSGGPNEFDHGGRGGGAVKLTVGGILSVGGTMSSNGETTGSHPWNDAGGGAGGSIYVIADTITGSGSITVNGGNSIGGGGGGGGAGGRIAIYYNTKSYSGSVTATGGTGWDNGDDGTIIFNDAPTTTSLSGISQATNGSGYVSFSTTVSDPDLDNTRFKVEYSDDSGVSWYDPYLVSATPDSGSTDIDNAQTYQIGSNDAIDTAGGAVTLSVVWDTKNVSNGNGSLDTTDQSDIQLRVTPSDFIEDGTMQTSGDFEVDNLSPQGLTLLSTVSYTSEQIAVQWIAATEAHFSHYEIWYGTNQTEVENRTGAATKWDNNDDANLANATADATTITGLTEGETYYLHIWAIDTFSNESDASTLTQMINAKPVASVPSAITQATNGTGLITFTVSVTDANAHNTKLKVEYSDNSGSTWYDPDLVSATPSSGSVDVDDAQTYQIGSVDAIDTSGGPITLTIVWDTQSTGNSNGSLDETDQSDIQLKVTPADSIEDGGAKSSNSFEVDNLSPQNYSDLAVSDFKDENISIDWNAPTEANFDHYEYWYGTNQADVESRTGTAEKWDQLNDANLSTRTTNTTTLTSLTAAKTYYIKGWAIDQFGNFATSGVVFQRTNHLPVVTIPNTISQSTSGSGEISFTLAVSDSDANSTKLKIEYSDDGGSHWYAAQIVSADASSGSASVNNSQAYQIGGSNGIDTQNGIVTLIVIWDTQSAQNGNGSLNNGHFYDVKLRATPNDFHENGTTKTTDDFSVDNLAPQNFSLKNLEAIDNDGVKINWQTPVEPNFNTYTIAYGTSQDEVENQNGAAQILDKTDHDSLGDLSVDQITVAPLNAGQPYYFKLWALDDFGNLSETAIASIQLEQNEVINDEEPQDKNPQDENPSNDDQQEEDNQEDEPIDQKTNLTISHLNIVISESLQADINWETNLDATTELEYGLANGHLNGQILKTELTQDHQIVLTGLLPNARYYFKTISAVDDQSASQEGSFDTPWLVYTSIQLEKLSTEIGPTYTQGILRILSGVPILGSAGSNSVQWLMAFQENKLDPIVNAIPIILFPVMLPSFLPFVSSFIEILRTLDLWKVPGVLLGMLRKKRYPWGIVYDSVTKEPLDPVILTLKNHTNEEWTTISDLFGRYEFLVAPGVYTITAKKTNFEFPSQKLAHKQTDGLYENLYYGGQITIEDNQKLMFNIPLDPVAIDWNQQEKRRRGILSPLVITLAYKIARLIFILSSLLTIISFLLLPTVFGLISLIILSVLILLTLIKGKQKGWGVITDQANKPIKHAYVHLVNTELPSLKYPPVVTDETGRYNFLIQKGNYQIIIEIDSESNQRIEIYRSDKLQIRTELGYIGKDIKIAHANLQAL